MKRKLMLFVVMTVFLGNVLRVEASELLVDNVASVSDNNLTLEDSNGTTEEILEQNDVVPENAGCGGAMAQQEGTVSENEVQNQEDEVLDSECENIEPINVDEEVEVINIEFPSKLPIVIDPYEIAGNGQVYSELFRIENKGNALTSVIITEVPCIYAEDEGVKPCKMPDSLLEETEAKRIYMELKFYSETEKGLELFETVCITDDEAWQPVNVQIMPGESVLFEVTGALSLVSEQPWKLGDVEFSISYMCELMEEKEPLESDTQNVEESTEEEVEETNYETEESVVVTSEEETTSVENSIEEMIAEQSGMDECVTEGIAEDKDSNGISSE